MNRITACMALAAMAFAPMVSRGENGNVRSYVAFSETGNGIGCIAFSPGGRWTLSGSKDGTIRLWDLETGKLHRKLSGHDHYVRGVAFLSDGHRAISGSLDGTLRLWDVQTGEEKLRCQIGTKDGRSNRNWRQIVVAVSPDGRRALSCEDRVIRYWNLETGRQMYSIQEKIGSLESVAISPDGRSALTGGSDQMVRLWDLETGRQMRSFPGHGDYVRSVAFSPDGRIAASGARDRRIFLWDLVGGKQIRRLRGHTDWVDSVMFSPDGTRLLSGSRDKTVRLWNLETGQHRILGGDEHNVFAVAFSAAGRRALSGTMRGVTVWTLPTSLAAGEQPEPLDLKPAVLKSAWKQLESKDRRLLIQGAEVLHHLGVMDDFARYLKLLDRGLVAMKNNAIENHSYHTGTANRALVDAGWQMIQRGADVPAKPQTPGEAALFMMAVGKREDFRPADLPDTIKRLLRHPIPHVRVVTLENLPPELFQSLHESLAPLFQDEYVGVQGAICILAAKSGEQRYMTLAVDVLTRTKKRDLVGIAYRAAERCGAARDRLLDICINRVGEPDLGVAMFSQMIKIVEDQRGYGFQRPDRIDFAGVKGRWKQLLAAHRDDIRAGKQFKTAQPPITADLFPIGFRFRRKGGSHWPPNN